MQWNLGTSMGRMTAQLIRNHPFAYDVQVLRKVIKRTEDSTSMGGIPTFGGVGALDSQDENAYEYEFLCNAHAVKAMQYQPGNMTDNLDAPIGSDEEFVHLMTPARDKNHPEWDTVQFKTKDVVLFVLGADADSPRLAFEVGSVDATCQLPPFMPRYVLNRRADLDIPAGLPDAQEPPEGEPDGSGQDDTSGDGGNPVATPENDQSEIGVLSD